MEGNLLGPLSRLSMCLRREDMSARRQEQKGTAKSAEVACWQCHFRKFRELSPGGNKIRQITSSQTILDRDIWFAAALRDLLLSGSYFRMALPSKALNSCCTQLQPHQAQRHSKSTHVHSKEWTWIKGWLARKEMVAEELNTADLIKGWDRICTSLTEPGAPDQAASE